MTRINVGIRASVLTDKHLMAEHREIKRIPNCIAKGRFNMKGQPDLFTLGTGHVKFFYDKCGYLLKRYEELSQTQNVLNVGLRQRTMLSHVTIVPISGLRNTQIQRNEVS